MAEAPCHGELIVTWHMVKGVSVEHGDFVIGATTALLERLGWQPGTLFEVGGVVYEPAGRCPAVPNEIMHMRRRDE